MAIRKVLVVDDSKTELMFMTDLLQKNGFAVKTAESAEDAFRRLAEEKPDLILMDVVMPGQNGFQLTRAISRDPLYAETAHFTVETGRPSVPTLVNMVLMQLELAGVIDPSAVPSSVSAPAPPDAP